MRNKSNSSTQRRQNLKANYIGGKITDIKPNKLYKSDFNGEFKEIQKKVTKYEEGKFNVILKHPDIVKLTKNIDAQKAIILHNKKENRVVFPIKAKTYEEAYLMANDIVAMIHKKKGN